MTRDHVVPTGCPPLFPVPRSAPLPRPHRSRTRQRDPRPHGSRLPGPPAGPASPLTGLPPEHDLLLRTLRPVLAHLSADAVAFGRTAAYVWGVDLYPRGTAVTRNRLHVAVPPGVEGAARAGVLPHRERIPESARTRVLGVRVTTAARTALDVAASSPSLYSATAALDRFLTLRLTTGERLGTAALTHPRRAQSRLKRALRLADPRSQSPAESWTRVLLHEANLPKARPQCPVPSGQGLFHADLGWPLYRVVVEYDSAEHHSSRHERARDELRYAAMEEAGWLVVSVGVYDLCAHPGEFLRRVLAALTERGWSAPPERLERIRRAVRRFERQPPRLGEEPWVGHNRP
ncbi:endonuclease domain-containing protein [Nocardiopsis ganjiahuensis]|uniref:endonuclease domain-containing protein n=1 Tax=Nocardiopsis ganjiahuensis TaxID=239984 RepID=UPI00034953D3|nr:hypothetical protein [Nocardiopsis ganjiahuensis]